MEPKKNKSSPGLQAWLDLGLSFCSLGLVGGLPGMAPDSPRLSPLGGVMASVTPVSLAPQPPIFLHQEKARVFPSGTREVPLIHALPWANPCSCGVIGRTCHLLHPGSRLETGWLLGRQTAEHCVHMCLWAKGPPRGVPPGLAEVGEILIGPSPVILPFAHQTKWRRKERFF